MASYQNPEEPESLHEAAQDASSGLQMFRDNTLERQMLTYSRVAVGMEPHTRELAYRRVAEELRIIETIPPPSHIHHNAPRMISWLPVEILSQIFRICASTDPGPIFNEENKRELGWINLTHVCSYWRRIACEDSALWTDISQYEGEKWMDTKLSRAWSALLTVEIYSSSSTVIALLRPHLHHIKELYLDLDHVDSLEAASTLFDNPAPALARLNVSLGTRLRDTGREAHQASLPFKIFSSTPCLRELVLFDTFIDFSKPLPSTLDTFSYQFECVEQVRPLSIEDLSPLLLANTDSIELLTLSRCLPNATPSPSRPFHLHRLKELTLTGSLNECESVLSALQTPSDCRLHIHYDDWSIGEEDHLLESNSARIASCISNHLEQGNGLNKIKQFHLEFYGDSHLLLSGWRAADGGEVGSSPGIHVEFKLDQFAVPQIINTVRGLPVREVAHLSLSFDEWDLEDPEDLNWDWLEVFQVFPAATTLSVKTTSSDGWWQGVFKALTARSATAASEPLPEDSPPRLPSSPAALPYIVRLEIKAEFHEPRDLKVYSDMLFDVVSTRREDGVGLHELHLAATLCEGIEEIPNTTADCLRKVVPDVVTQWSKHSIVDRHRRQLLS